MPLDSATTSFLGQLAQPGAKPIYEQPVEVSRQLGKRLLPLYGTGPDVASVEQRTLTSPDGARFEVRVLTPENPRGVLVYLHGGGWVLGGGLDGNDTMGRILARDTGCTVVLVDYRLAPESRFPAALVDAKAAWEWVWANRGSLATEGCQVVLAGDSAGANLSVGVSRGLRGTPRTPAQLVLAYPVTDCDLDRASYLDPANQLLLDRRAMEWFWDHYLPDVARRVDPEASPLRDEDLSGLPPTVVLIAEMDVLRDEGEEFVARIQAAGGSVTQQLFEGQMHGFLTMVNILPGSAAGLDYIAGKVNAILTG
jgi:acetyl esterase